VCLTLRLAARWEAAPAPATSAEGGEAKPAGEGGAASADSAEGKLMPGDEFYGCFCACAVAVDAHACIIFICTAPNFEPGSINAPVIFPLSSPADWGVRYKCSWRVSRGGRRKI
jgi:hypothetical protein